VISNFRKMGEFAASIERSKAKSVSASGGKAAWPPDQGLCPWTPDLRYRLALSALAMPIFAKSPLFIHTPVAKIWLFWRWLCLWNVSHWVHNDSVARGSRAFLSLRSEPLRRRLENRCTRFYLNNNSVLVRICKRRFSGSFRIFPKIY